MERLWNLYQERLDQLNQTFLTLLQQFENNSLFTTHELSKYRLEYLADIIEKTLKNKQQKLILKLYQQINQLKQTNIKLQQHLDQLNQSEQYSQEQSLVAITKVSTSSTQKYHQNDSGDLQLDTCPSKFGRKENNIKRTKETKKQNQTLKQQQKQKQNQKNNNKISNHQPYSNSSIKAPQYDDDDDMSVISSSFKYLKF